MIPGPPALVTIATRSPARDRLLGQQRGDVEQLVQRVGADHAGLLEQRVDGDVGGGQQRPGVRRGRARPGRRAAALDRQDRLLAGDPAARRGRTCAGCRTTRGTAGRRRCPGPAPSTAGSRCPTGRPCCRPRRTTTGRARAAPAASMIAMPSPPLCDRKPTGPAIAGCGANVAFSRTFGVGVEHAEAVRADQPHARRRGRPRATPAGAATPSSPASAKPAEMTSSARTPAAAQSRATSTTCAAGTTTTASSTCAGIVADRRYAGSDWTTSACGLTA